MTDISILTSNKTFCSQQIDGASVVSNLLWLQEECQERMMTDAVKWTAEVMQFVPEQWITDFDKDEQPSSSKNKSRLTLTNRSVTLARSLCLTKEFARACYYLSKVKNDNPVNKFLYYWSRYLMCEKIKLENEAEALDHKITSNGFENKDDHDLAELLRDMSNENLDEFDAFLYYLLAKIERSIGSNAGAFVSMKKAIEMEPRLWPAWDEIVELIPTPNDVHAVYLLEKQGSTSWMSDWFASLALRHFNYDRQAAEKMEQLLSRGFPNVPMLLSHRAAMADRMLEHTSAIDLFMKLREMDPLRIEDMHLYCDSLFCMSERTELTSLTHSFYKTHKFFWETAYIVGNYYTIRGEHEQAIRFFQRALRLNPKQASIWVVIGHEFVELKNNSAACLAYRRAIEIDPQEYRAWYGLGQLYDILKMNVYALYYYQEAHKCRPNDSRILVALGLIYSKMERSRDALKCFTAAHKNGDVEGTALWHLAKIFEREEMMDKAARTYEEYLNALDSMEMINDNVPYIIQFLAKHNFGKGEWDKSKKFAERCLLCDSIAEEGRKILRDIAAQEEEVLDVPTTADISADMQISDGEEDVSYD